MWFRKAKKPEVVVETMRELRQKALAVSAAELSVTPGPGHERVWGVLMETGYPGAVVTLASFIEGSTSMYFSTGGGVIGAGEHNAVRVVAEQFIGVADRFADRFVAATEYPLPTLGRVRFYVRTFDGIRTAEADEQALGNRQHELWPVFHAGHAVIAAIRQTGKFPGGG